jgi:uncharacterized protein (TIGR02588 family)
LANRRRNGEETGAPEERAARGSAAEGERESVSRWEWVVAALSAVVVLGAIGAMLYQAFTTDDAPPDVTIAVEDIRDLGGGYLVEFSARNGGGSTAAGLAVEGTLEADTGEVETATATLDYVPARASRGGGLYFRNDPRDYRLTVRAKGYERP